MALISFLFFVKFGDENNETLDNKLIKTGPQVYEEEINLFGEMLRVQTLKYHMIYNKRLGELKQGYKRGRKGTTDSNLII